MTIQTSNKTLVLLDGNALLHRAWHAIPPLTTKDGRVVNAAYGFAMALDTILKQWKPEYMVVAWDLPGKTFRHEAFEAYKAQRKEKEPELYAQIPLIQEILTYYGIPSVSVPGFEADDVIGTLATTAKKDKMNTLIVTGDQDQMQLVDDTTKLVYFIKGISETKTFDEAAVVEKYGFRPEQMIDYKALRGDPSDNIPGVKGIGEKGAKELIAEFGNVEAMLAAVGTGKLEPAMERKLAGFENVAREMVGLVTIVRDVPLGDFSIEDAAVATPDVEKLLGLYKELEFKTLIRRLGPVDTNPQIGYRTTNQRIAMKVQIVRGTANVATALDAISDETVAVIVADQAPDLFGAKLAAISVSDGTGTVVIPSPNAELLAMVEKKIAGAAKIVSHDWKKTMHLTGWTMDERTVDLMVVSYLLSSASRSHDLASIIPTVVLPASFGTDKELALLGEAAQKLPAAATTMLAQLKDAGMSKLLNDIEMPLVPVLCEMEKAGIAVNVDSLGALQEILAKKIDALTKQIQELAGEEFNVNSPGQLATILFDKLQLPTKGIKKTTTGYSTAASELEKLEDTHDIIPLVGEYREHAKLQSTYVEALPKLVAEDGRIHTTYNQTVAATGRLSSVEPNLQNIPIKSDLGNEIRKAFVAEKGKVLIAADYSQVELRLAAVIAKDQPFIDAFRDGADIHTRTASEVWEIPEADVTGDQRRAAKAINFGILYGMGPRSLAKSTGMGMDEAKGFIDRYFQIHHAIRTYLDETKLKAHKDGYVETLFGRRRYFPEINTGVQMLVAMAERMAINMPVQGTAADLMKLAMLAVDGWLKTSKWPAKMLLQVHDELVIECDEMAVDAVAKGVKEMMEGVASFDVPLVVEVEVGKNWGEMKAWESGK